MGIPTVTGMYPENPAADLFRKDTYIVKTEILSSTLRKAAPVMCSIGLRLLKGEHIAGAQEEGYIIRDIILNEEQPLNAAERSIEMLMKKMRGEALRVSFCRLPLMWWIRRSSTGFKNSPFSVGD